MQTSEKRTLEDYTIWSRKRASCNHKTGNIAHCQAGGYRTPQKVVDAILEDAQSGTFKTMKDLATKNGVSPITCKRYLKLNNIEFKKPR